MQLKSFLLSVFCFVFWSMAVSGQQTLFGKILSDEQGDPIPGAAVYVPEAQKGAVSSDEGTFSIADLKPGDYTLRVSCMGYKTLTQKIHFSGKQTPYELILKKNPMELVEVVVTGTGTPHSLKNVPVQTELISKRTIQKVAPTDFIDLMSAVSPSFDFSPGSMGPFLKLNGLGNDYILILIDGKRVYGDIGGQNDLNRINPADIQQIEVVRGASSALYGSEAIAGVINIITRKPSEKLSVVADNRLGSYNNWVQHYSLDLNAGKWTSQTTFDRKTIDGWQLSKYKLYKGELVETDDLAQNPTTDYTIGQKITFSPNKRFTANVNGSYYERDIRRPLTVRKYGYLYKDFSYTANASYKISDVARLVAQWESDHFRYYYRYNQDYKDFVVGDEDKQTDQLRNALNVRGIFNWGQAQKILAGTEYVDENLESSGRLRDPKVSAYTWSLYAQDEITLTSDLNVVAGARLVKHKEFGGAFTPKVALLYKPLEHFNVRATYARGFKAPTLKELYYHYEKTIRGKTYLYLGNPDLKPQTSDYYAASIEFLKDKLSASVTAYLNNVDDLIDYQTTDVPAEDVGSGIDVARMHYNIAKARTKGVDVLFDIPLGAGFSTGGGYSYVDARNLTEKVRLNGVAENYGTVHLTYGRAWKNYHFSTRLNGRFQDEKFYDDGKAKAYQLWRLTTTHRLRTSDHLVWDVTAGIDNLFDYVDRSPYGSHYGTISPGRTWFASLRIGFSQ